MRTYVLIEGDSVTKVTWDELTAKYGSRLSQVIFNLPFVDEAVMYINGDTVIVRKE